MAFHKIEIAPELIAEGKRLYERTLTPMRDIAAYMGISRRTLENRIREWNWSRRRTPTLPIELHHAVRGAAFAVLAEGTSTADGGLEAIADERRAALAVRIHEAVERAIAATERVLEQIDPSDPSEVERNARALAGVSRTLREFAALNRPTETEAPHEADHDPVPCDPDELRTELARRINALIDARQRRESGGDGGVVAPVSPA